jgi:hypothetical protein
MKSIKPAITILDPTSQNWAKRICSPLKRYFFVSNCRGPTINCHAPTTQKNAINEIQIAILVLLFLIGTPLKAQSQPITIMGNYDCGQWFQNPHAKDWLAGYVSGLSAALAKDNQDPLKKLNSGAQLFLWMDNYCKANPLDKVSDGAHALYAELVTVKKP